MFSGIMKKGIIALIGMIVALVFIIVALVGPWYSVGIKYSGANENVDFSLTRAKGTMLGIPVDEGYDSEGMDETAKNVFNYSMYITIFTLIICILALIGILGFVFGFGKPDTMKKLGLVFGILTFVLALVAVLYFMTALPVKTLGGGVVDDIGFWYSKSQSGAEISMGPGFSWYLMIAAAIIALIASIAMLLKKSAPETAIPVPPTQ
jgi:hypothetical protein